MVTLLRGNFRRTEAGFTYLAVLAAVVVTGIALSGAGQYWRILMQRDREAELLFRGDRIRSAIAAYVRATPSGRQDAYPRRLEDLLVDPRFPDIRKYLRRIYTDPMTEDGEWTLILDTKGGLKGVASTSERKPIKTGNFPSPYENFQTAKNYKDWKFIYDHPAAPAASPKPQPEEGATQS